MENGTWPREIPKKSDEYRDLQAALNACPRNGRHVSIVKAWYYYCTCWHGGQSSQVYSILSEISLKYRSEHRHAVLDFTRDEMSKFELEYYASLVRKFEGKNYAA